MSILMHCWSGALHYQENEALGQSQIAMLVIEDDTPTKCCKTLQWMAATLDESMISAWLLPVIVMPPAFSCLLISHATYVRTYITLLPTTTCVLRRKSLAIGSFLRCQQLLFVAVLVFMAVRVRVAATIEEGRGWKVYCYQACNVIKTLVSSHLSCELN